MAFQRPHHAKHSTRVKGCQNFLVHSSMTAPRWLVTLRIVPLPILRYGHSSLAHVNHDHRHLASFNRTTQGTDIFYLSLNRLLSGSMNFSVSLFWRTLHPFGWRFLITTLCFHHTHTLSTADVLSLLFHVLAMAQFFSGSLLSDTVISPNG